MTNVMRRQKSSAFIEAVLLLSTLCFLSPFVYAQKTGEFGEQLIEARYTSVPPTIDGVVNANEWGRAEFNTVDYVNLGTAGNGGPGDSDGPEDASYTFRILYDDTYLYIGVTVKDDIYVSTNYGQRLQWDLPVTWENDAVEYFFDGDLSQSTVSARNPAESETGGQWIFGTEADDSPVPFISPELYGETDRPYGTGTDDVWYAQTTVDENTADWQQEARFKLSIIGSPSANSQIGFDIAVGDVDTEDPDSLTPDYYAEVRDIQLYWTVFGYGAGEIAGGNTHELEELWGIIKFLEPLGGGEFDGITLNADGTVTIKWTGGPLQSATAVTGPYSDVAENSPLTVTPGDKAFYRIAP